MESASQCIARYAADGPRLARCLRNEGAKEFVGEFRPAAYPPVDGREIGAFRRHLA